MNISEPHYPFFYEKIKNNQNILSMFFIYIYKY